jgi:hypothetical protein
VSFPSGARGGAVDVTRHDMWRLAGAVRSGWLNDVVRPNTGNVSQAPHRRHHCPSTSTLHLPPLSQPPPALLSPHFPALYPPSWPT